MFSRPGGSGEQDLTTQTGTISLEVGGIPIIATHFFYQCVIGELPSIAGFIYHGMTLKLGQYLPSNGNSETVYSSTEGWDTLPPSLIPAEITVLQYFAQYSNQYKQKNNYV